MKKRAHQRRDVSFGPALRVATQPASVIDPADDTPTPQPLPSRRPNVTPLSEDEDWEDAFFPAGIGSA
jgi:hypothetical protein